MAGWLHVLFVARVGKHEITRSMNRFLPGGLTVKRIETRASLLKTRAARYPERGGPLG
jgi:hypothetical protein